MPTNSENIYLLQTIIPNPIINASNSNSGIEILKKIPAKDLYRLFVDGCYHSKQNLESWLQYEISEPGSVVAALKAFKISFDALNDKSLTPDLIKNIHRQALDFSTYEKKTRVKSGIFRTTPMGFTLQCRLNNEEHYNTSKKGMKQLIEKINNNKASDFFIAKTDDRPSWIFLPNSRKYKIALRNENDYRLVKGLFKPNKEDTFTYIAPPVEKLESILNEICQIYNSTIRFIHDRGEKIKLIAKTIQEIEQLHAFPDGNLRTCIILLQRLLLQNSIEPVMLFEPNVFDCFSTDELVQIIEEGIQNTRSLIEKNELFDYRTPDDLNDQISKKYEYEPPEMRTFSDFSNYDEVIDELFNLIQSLPDNFLEAPTDKSINQNSIFYLKPAKKVEKERVCDLMCTIS